MKKYINIIAMVYFLITACGCNSGSTQAQSLTDIENGSMGSAGNKKLIVGAVESQIENYYLCSLQNGSLNHNSCNALPLPPNTRFPAEIITYAGAYNSHTYYYDNYYTDNSLYLTFYICSESGTNCNLSSSSPIKNIALPEVTMPQNMAMQFTSDGYAYFLIHDHKHKVDTVMFCNVLSSGDLQSCTESLQYRYFDIPTSLSLGPNSLIFVGNSGNIEITSCSINDVSHNLTNCNNSNQMGSSRLLYVLSSQKYIFAQNDLEISQCKIDLDDPGSINNFSCSAVLPQFDSKSPLIYSMSANTISGFDIYNTFEDCLVSDSMNAGCITSESASSAGISGTVQVLQSF